MYESILKVLNLDNIVASDVISVHSSERLFIGDVSGKIVENED